MTLPPLLSGSDEFALSWACAAAVVALSRWAYRRPWNEALGIGVMSVPAWGTFWTVLPDVALPFIGFVPQPESVRSLSDRYIGTIVYTLGHLFAGFLLYASPSWRAFWRLDVRTLAARLRDAGPALGRGEARSVAWGLAGFPVLLAANVVLLLATSGLRNADESGLFRHMTPWHATLVAAAAAVGEEMLYRAFLMVACTALLVPIVRRAGLPRAWAVGGALGLQALLFAFAHEGYGNVQHLAFAAAFAAAIGLVVLRFGLWTAILLHALVDFFVLGLEATSVHVHAGWITYDTYGAFGWFLPVLAAALAADVAFSAWWFAARRWRRPPAASRARGEI